MRSFESEAEARVVEAFLKANDIEVQLLGTHTHPSAVAPGSLKTASMRLMVHNAVAGHAEELLKEAEARAHLMVVPDVEPPPIAPAFSRQAIALILIGLALLAYAKWLFV